MIPGPTLQHAPQAWGRAILRSVSSWWHLLHFAAIVGVLVLSPSTYRHDNRAATSRYIYASTWQVLPWFTVLAALLSLVLIRIVVVTALSYGLSQYALQMVVRVLVLELIPLSAALFVTLRAGLSLQMMAPVTPSAVAAPELSLELLCKDVVPRVLATTVSVLALTMVSSVIALVLAYLTVHGFTLWGLPGYTRTVGKVFDPAVTAGFALKAVAFSLAVAIVPIAAGLEEARQPRQANTVQAGAVRLFLVLLWIEAASLVVKYI